MSNSFENIKNNWAQYVTIITFVFVVGGTLTRFEMVEKNQAAIKETMEDYNATLHRRVSATNKDIDILEDEIKHDINEVENIQMEIIKVVEYQRGYLDAFVEFSKEKK